MAGGRAAGRAGGRAGWQRPDPVAGAARDTAPAAGRALDTTWRQGAREREPGPGSSPARANGAPRVGQGPPDVP